MGLYRDLAAALPIAWLKGEWGEKFKYLNAVLTDELYEGSRLAVQARLVSYAPDDAVPLIGADVKIEQGRTEALADYRVRLGDPFGSGGPTATDPTIPNSNGAGWYWGGTELGSLASYNAYGLSNVVHKGVFLSGFQRCAGGDWNWDGDGSNWSRFWVVIYPPHPWTTRRKLGDPDGAKLGDGRLLGLGNMKRAEADRLRRIARQQKAGEEVCDRIIVVFDQAAFDAALPDGTWADHTQWNPHAAYLDG